MRHRTLDEMVSYFNQQVSEMDIDQSYKIQLLGMVSAIVYGVQKPQWIPCSERLPEENIPVLFCIRFKDDFKCFVTTRTDYDYWTGVGRGIRGTMAWMPLPEPWRGEENG